MKKITMEFDEQEINFLCVALINAEMDARKCGYNDFGDDYHELFKRLAAIEKEDGRLKS